MNDNREPKKYLVAGYVKNALLWKNRNPEEMQPEINTVFFALL